MYAICYPTLQEKIKIKGLKNPQISFDEFKEKFFQGETFASGERQLFKNNLEFNETNIIKLINFDRTQYTKRIFSNDLKTTCPIVIIK